MSKDSRADLNDLGHRLGEETAHSLMSSFPFASFQLGLCFPWILLCQQSLGGLWQLLLAKGEMNGLWDGVEGGWVDVFMESVFPHDQRVFDDRVIRYVDD